MLLTKANDDGKHKTAFLKGIAMNAMYALTLLLFSCIGLTAQYKGDLYNISQRVNQMQIISEIVPNAQFPFGQPLKLVKQQDRSLKKVFILGVYASAVHAKWFSPEGRLLCQALAVASEPEIFWKGENATEIISRITIPPEVGYLEAAGENFNGPSGRTLDELYLMPLGLSRSDVWLCDLVPHSLMNPDQNYTIQNSYAPLREEYNLPAASIPERLQPLSIDDNRRNEILAELEESQAETIILLGDEPIEWFLSFVSDCKKTRLVEFGIETYGSPISVIINSKPYSVIPLTHTRQAGRHGQYSDIWYRAHTNWLETMNSRK